VRKSTLAYSLACSPSFVERRPTGFPRTSTPLRYGRSLVGAQNRCFFYAVR
jgi:hypothetical protein